MCGAKAVEAAFKLSLNSFPEGCKGVSLWQSKLDWGLFLLEVRSNLIVQTIEIVGTGRQSSFASSLKELYRILSRSLLPD
jgi:hypothetical protein